MGAKWYSIWWREYSEKGAWSYVLFPQEVIDNSRWKTELKKFYLQYYSECELWRIYQLYSVIEHHANAAIATQFGCGHWKYVFFPTYFKVIYSTGNDSTACEYNINWDRRDILDRNSWKSYLQLLGGYSTIKPKLVGFPFEDDDRMNLKTNQGISDIKYTDDEEEIIKKIQKAIDEIYGNHPDLCPDLCYGSIPKICLQVNKSKYESVGTKLIKQGENMNIDKESYEEIIHKLCDVLDIMDDEDFKKSMDKNQKLQYLYHILNKTTTQFEELQKDTKLKEKNDELIDKCVDTECNFSRKTKTDYLSVLIKDYREVNKLDIQDTVENLIKAINVEAGELLEIINFDKVIDPKKVEEELADVLIYCFSLANELSTPVDRIIARKIKKNIERNRKYEK